MLWREEQRAIGERMLLDGGAQEDGTLARCIGFATFVERYEADKEGTLGGINVLPTTSAGRTRHKASG